MRHIHKHRSDHIKYNKRERKKSVLLIIIALIIITLILVVVLINLKSDIRFSPKTSENPCFDTDNGANYLVSGTASKGDIQLKDFCVDDKRLIEHFCLDDKIKADQFTCQNICSRGACS